MRDVFKFLGLVLYAGQGVLCSDMIYKGVEREYPWTSVISKKPISGLGRENSITELLSYASVYSASKDQSLIGLILDRKKRAIDNYGGPFKYKGLLVKLLKKEKLTNRVKALLF